MKAHYRINKGLSRTKSYRYFLVAFVALGVIGFAGLRIFNALPGETEPDKKPVEQTSLFEDSPAMIEITEPLPWPTYGYSAYGVPKDNVFAASSKENVQVPIASLAKVITVLAVLEKKPLTVGEQGPLITLDAEDAALVDEYARKDGIYIPVLEGDSITELSALQAIMLVSANNIADSVARWAFGSVEAYTQYANEMLRNLGIEDTVVADASGFSPQTISTAKDMTKIGYLYMQHPVLRGLATQESATILNTWQLKNYNSFANQEGIIGIKVGNTDEAKRTFLAASIRKNTSNQEEISIAAVLGAETLQIAAIDAVNILKAGDDAHARLKNTKPQQ